MLLNEAIGHVFSINSREQGREAHERTQWLGGKLLAEKYDFFRKARKVPLISRA